MKRPASKRPRFGWIGGASLVLAMVSVALVVFGAHRRLIWSIAPFRSRCVHLTWGGGAIGVGTYTYEPEPPHTYPYRWPPGLFVVRWPIPPRWTEYLAWPPISWRSGGVVVALWFPALLLGGVATVRWQRHRPWSDSCVTCGYSLAGLRDPRCPECGTWLPREVQRAVLASRCRILLMTTDADIRAVAAQIAADFRPERIVLFGSRAAGTAHEESDVDLLVILPFEGSALRKTVEILDRVNPPFAIDLLIHTPEEAARRYRAHDPIVGEAFDRGVVLYEAAA